MTQIYDPTQVLNTVTNYLQQYNILQRIQQIEAWRDQDAIPTIQKTLQDIQNQQNQILTQQQDILNAAKQAQQAYQTGQDALTSASQAFQKASTVNDLATNAFKSASDALGKATQAYNNASDAWNTEFDLFRRSFKSIADNMATFVSAVYAMAKWITDVAGVMGVRVQDVVNNSGVKSVLGIIVPEHPLGFMIAASNALAYVRDVYNASPGYWNNIQNSGSSLTQAFTTLYNKVQNVPDLGKI